MPYRLAILPVLAAAASLTAVVGAPTAIAGTDAPTFGRIATLPVFLNTSLDVEMVSDSFCRQSRVFPMDISSVPAVIDGEFFIRDTAGLLLAALQDLTKQLPGTGDFEPNSDAPGDDFVLLTKSLVRDIVAEGDHDVTGGLVPEKLEGLTILPDGTTWIANDNDGVDDDNSETRLLNLGDLFD